MKDEGLYSYLAGPAKKATHGPPSMLPTSAASSHSSTTTKGGPKRTSAILVAIALGTALFVLTRSSESSPSRPAPAEEAAWWHNFPPQGLKHELWQRLDEIMDWEITIDPVTVKWKRERDPKTDEVYWATGSLMGSILDLPVYPRRPVTPRNAPKLDELMFGFVTTAKRARVMSELWTGWMLPDGPSGVRPPCLVMLSEKEKNETEALTTVLRERGLACDVTWSGEERYEVRVLSMTREMPRYARHKHLDIKWYIWNDDDTFWLDQASVRRMLSKYDPKEPTIVGATSEAADQVSAFGRMAFGGAGIFVTEKLMRDMEANYAECWERWRNLFGGDEMVTRCAALAKGPEWTKSTVTVEERGLHQFDIPGDGTGVFQAGLPLLNLHHYLKGSWTRLFGYSMNYMEEFDQIRLLKKVASFLGGDNMFERYVFDNGHWLLVNGYSLTLFEEPLTRPMLKLAEHTWYQDYRLSIDDRPEIPERRDDRGRAVKQTFYIDDLIFYEPESEQAKKGVRATFVYASADKWDEDVPRELRKRIHVHWYRERRQGQKDPSDLT